MTLKLDPDTRRRLESLQKEAQRRLLRNSFSSPGGLLRFVKHFWHILEPQTKFVDGWPLHAICLHLEAVSRGEITRLLINVPPGFMKSLLVDVFWPAWEWATIGAHLRYVTFSYSSSLTERDNRRFGALVSSPEYQDLYGQKVQVVMLGAKMVSNQATGWKLASSVGGVGTGERGNRVILDDPHNVKEAESEIVRGETIRWFRESMSNRLNDMEADVIIVIMQRLHGDDVSGVILEMGMAYEHLMIPMEYDFGRQTDEHYEPVRTSIGWYDPRYDEGDADEVNGMLAWPERFSEDVWEKIQTDIGPYAVAGQYGQSPAPRGGGIFRREWWQLWESPDGRFPVFDYLVASLDSAFTEQERNDPSALTVWGVFTLPSLETTLVNGRADPKTGKIWHSEVSSGGQPRIMLVHAWRKHLQFSGPRMDMAPGESKQHWVQRTQPTWGLMEWVKYTCERFRVEKLLIEAKASGISAAQELSNRYGRLDFAVQLCQVAGSKEARAYAAQPTFSQLLVYAPARDWADMVISEMESFPKHKYRDLTDSATQAVKHLRSLGLANTDEESKAIEVEEQIRDLAKLKRGSVAEGYFS
jgi:predicted phage terminase large subunit-like protein